MIEIMGEQGGTVNNKIITALLQAYLDLLDHDGLESILREAEMLHLKDVREIDPDLSLNFCSFKKILSAQDCLLYGSHNLLFEIGRKMALYLFPFGKKIRDVVDEINELIKTNWRVEIVKRSEKIIIIKIKNCVFCAEGDETCDLFKGFLLYSIEKSLSGNFKVSKLEREKRECANNNIIFRFEIENDK